MELHGLRPVTQARMTGAADKSPSPNSDFMVRGNFLDAPDWNPASKRPLTINSTKLTLGRKAHYQPTCYGGFRMPVKARFVPDPATIAGAKCPSGPGFGRIVSSYGTNKSPTVYGAATEARFFPSEAGAAARTPAEGMRTGNIRSSGLCCYEGAGVWQRLRAHRRVTTSECVGGGGLFGRQKLPVLCRSPRPSENTLARPYTGVVQGKAAVIAEAPPRKQKGGGRLGTALAGRRTLMIPAQPGQGRVSTPQTAPEKRPDSRYNRATLYAKLEHGRGNSPEYQVPIIDMRFAEFSCGPIMPECWK